MMVEIWGFKEIVIQFLFLYDIFYELEEDEVILEGEGVFWFWEFCLLEDDEWFFEEYDQFWEWKKEWIFKVFVVGIMGLLVELMLRICFGCVKRLVIWCVIVRLVRMIFFCFLRVVRDLCI